MLRPFIASALLVVVLSGCLDGTPAVPDGSPTDAPEPPVPMKWRREIMEFPITTTELVSPMGVVYLAAGTGPRFHVEPGVEALWLNVTSDLQQEADLQFRFTAVSTGTDREAELTTTGGTGSLDVPRPDGGDWELSTVFSTHPTAGIVTLMVDHLAPSVEPEPPEGWMWTETVYETDHATTRPVTPGNLYDLTVAEGTRAVRVEVRYEALAPGDLRGDLIDMDRERFYNFYTYDGEGSLLVEQPVPGPWRLRFFAADGAAAGHITATVQQLGPT